MRATDNYKQYLEFDSDASPGFLRCDELLKKPLVHLGALTPVWFLPLLRPRDDARLCYQYQVLFAYSGIRGRLGKKMWSFWAITVIWYQTCKATGKIICAIKYKNPGIESSPKITGI